MGNVYFRLAVFLCIWIAIADGEYYMEEAVVQRALFVLSQSQTLVSGASRSVSILAGCAGACLFVSSCKGFSFRKQFRAGQINCKLSTKGSMVGDDAVEDTDWDYFEMLPDLTCERFQACNRFITYPAWKLGSPRCTCARLGIVSKEKPADQASDNNFAFARLAVDGNRNRIFSGGSCSCTTSMDSPWWRVDLGAMHYVAAVGITNRSDCCHELFKNAEIRVGMGLQNNGNSNPLCRDTIPSLGKGETKAFRCNLIYAYGQYVNIILQGTGMLILCEVDVLGIKV